MFIAIAALFFQFPVFSSLQTSGKQSSPVATSKTQDRQVNSISASSGKIGLDSETRSADANVTSVAYAPGRLLPEPLAAVTPASADPDAITTSQIRAKPLPLVPVYVPFKVASERRRSREWLALGIAEHGAAGFDAWSTRHVLSLMPDAQEANPLLRPFAGNASIYAAVQVAPTIFDLLGRYMMNSRHAWMRNTWWLPQTISAAASLSSGVHNLGVYNSR